MPKKHFQDSKGRRIERIANETQLKQYLQGSWAEKSLGIAIEPGLRINHVGIYFSSATNVALIVH